MQDDLETRARLAPPAPPASNGDASLGALVRQLTDDGRTLIQQEVALAKAELQTNAVSFAKRAALLGIGIAVLIVGLLVLTAFLVLALGELLDDRYWLSSLIVGLAFAVLGAGGLLIGKNGLARQTLKPEKTVVTLKENTDWARAEARQLKHDLTRSDGRQ
jgi:uncharacterized membrane protein YqjE